GVTGSPVSVSDGVPRFWGGRGQPVMSYHVQSSELKQLEADVFKTKAELAPLKGINRQYEILLEEKRQLVVGYDRLNAAELLRLDEEEAGALQQLKELKEAHQAGEEAKEALERVIESLGSAENWGTWDLLGGGLLATAVKHSRMDDARKHAYQVQEALNRFQRELKDVNLDTSFHLEFDTFTRFADYFFDGLIVDWIVQSRIRDSLAGTRNQMSDVTAILSALQMEIKNQEKRADMLQRQRQELLENIN
ncbi:MAG: hypothetical protein ACYCX4_03110, partial [Bacillota bacterium]